MKIIVVYKSKTGFTARYARWIAEELGCDAVPYKQYLKNLEASDLLIYGGGLLAGKIAGFSEMVKQRSGNPMIVFTTGATPKEMTGVIEKIKKDNVTDPDISFYYFEGGIDYEKMGFFSKKILQTISKTLAKKSDRTEGETGMMEAMQESRDMTDRTYIEPLIAEVKAICMQ